MLRNEGRERVIENQSMILETIKQIAGKKVESCEDTLFDLDRRDDAYKEEKSVEDKFIFLKGVKVSDISFANDKEHPFWIVNNVTGEHIEVSNRAAMKNELRADVLRKIITDAQTTNPDQSAYDAVAAYITSPRSDLVAYLRTPAVALIINGVVESDGWEMTREHFEIFVGTFLQVCKERLERGDDLDDPNFMKDIDIGAVYDRTKELAQGLKEISDKADDLERRGYGPAAVEARQLYANLTAEIKKIGETGIDAAAVDRKCKGFIEAAQNGALREHRGFFGKIFHGIRVALNFITCGAVEVKQTSSMEKVSKVSRAVYSFFDQWKPKSMPDQGVHDNQSDLKKSQF